MADTSEQRTVRVGPRGFQGVVGWTFFDPANLVCVVSLAASALLVVVSMRGRGAPDWAMPLGLYLCVAVFLRGYIFSYYHGRGLGRLAVLMVLVCALLASAALWEDRAGAYRVLRASGLVTVPEAKGFHVAALLHVLCAATLVLHWLLPRRWLIRATDELADRTGHDQSPDALEQTKGEAHGPASAPESEEGAAGP